MSYIDVNGSGNTNSSATYYYKSSQNSNVSKLLIQTAHCNNCGKQGHLFHQCKLPITSYGMIVCRSSKRGIEFLMIRRKDSFGYIDIIRGKYSPYHVEQIQNSINEMSLSEKERLGNEPFEKLWKMMWGDDNLPLYRNEEIASSKKFDMIRNGIKITPTHKITLQELIEKSNTQWEETEWEFPKGRRNYQEKDLDCALREFEEETGYSKKDISVIENVLPFEELFIGSNHKSYKHKYFLASLTQDTNETMTNFQKSEVSKMEWKTLDECLASIRPYNLEKKKLIHNISKVLLEYRFYS
jgi:8-oxo-dGTP pyrophosphatase MutT (NUDIX family)